MRPWLLTLALSIFAATAVLAQVSLLPPAPPPKKIIKPKVEKDAPMSSVNFPRRLKQAEMQDRFFNGKPIHAQGLGGKSFIVTFFADGRTDRHDKTSNETVQGRWRILGDGYCSKWLGQAETCYSLVQDGDVVKVVRGTRRVALWEAAAAPPPENTAPALSEPAAPGLQHKRDRQRPNNPQPAAR